MIRIRFAFGLSLLLSTVLFGQDLKVPCRDAPSEAERGQCLVRADAQADAELGKTLASALAKVATLEYLPQPEREAYKASIQKAQTAWSSYKDIQCGEVLTHAYYRGSGAGNFKAECRWTKTMSRIKELKDQGN